MGEIDTSTLFSFQDQRNVPHHLGDPKLPFTTATYITQSLVEQGCYYFFLKMEQELNTAEAKAKKAGFRNKVNQNRELLTRNVKVKFLKLYEDIKGSQEANCSILPVGFK